MQTITKYLLFVFILLIISISPSRSQNLQRDFSCQVDSVLSLMTLEEKIGQLNQYSNDNVSSK